MSVLPREYAPALMLLPRYRQVSPLAGRRGAVEKEPWNAVGGASAGAVPRENPMSSLTRFVLRHKALVALFWMVVAVAGVLTVSGTTHRMTNNFSMPGQAFKVDNQIAKTYGNGGSQAPFVPVLTAPAGPADQRSSGRQADRQDLRCRSRRRFRTRGSPISPQRMTGRSSPRTAGQRSRLSTRRR